MTAVHFDTNVIMHFIQTTLIEIDVKQTNKFAQRNQSPLVKAKSNSYFIPNNISFKINPYALFNTTMKSLKLYQISSKLLHIRDA